MFLEQAIASVLDQSVSSFEILVVDDGSNDQAAKEIATICEMDDRIRLIRKNNNLGVSGARNSGIKEIRGDYVGFLDDDDRIAPSFLQYAIDSFDQQPNIDIALCQSTVDPNSTKSRFQYHVLKESLRSQPMHRTYEKKRPLLLYQYPPQINSMIFRKEIFDQFCFEESFDIGEDIYLWLELLRANFTFGKKQSNEPLSFIRVHDQDHLSQPPHVQIIAFLHRLQAHFGQMNPSLETFIEFKLFLRHLITGNIKLAIIMLFTSMKRPWVFVKIAISQTLLKARIIFSYVLFKLFQIDR